MINIELKHKIYKIITLEELIYSNNKSIIYLSNEIIFKRDVIKLSICYIKESCLDINFNEFQNLESISISNNNNIITIPTIKNKNIKHLFIYNNKKLKELPSLEKLKLLQNFTINICYDLTLLPSLDSCVDLKVFNCCGNNLIELPSLKGLTKLNTLICANNNLTQLPSLDDLTNLQFLNCCHNKLTHLPNLDKCINLENLNCSNNNLKVIPNLYNATKLKILNCFDNYLNKLCNLSNCKKLHKLYLYRNNIKSLSTDIIHLNRLLHHLPITNKYIYNNNLPELINWLIREKYYYRSIINYYNKIYLH